MKKKLNYRKQEINTAYYNQLSQPILKNKKRELKKMIDRKALLDVTFDLVNDSTKKDQKLKYQIWL